MTGLSPAAKAVWSAWEKAPMSLDLEQMDRDALAASLRAAANYCKRDKLILLSIADELEGSA